MKRGFLGVGIVIAILLLSGCQKDDSGKFPAENNAQNKYLLSDGVNFLETEEFFCGTVFCENYLQYYDKASGISGVLCADPSCIHDSSECGAYIKQLASLSFYDGNLYRITGGTTLRERYLCKSDLTGMNRENIMPISYEDILMTYQPQKYIVHQGKLFLLGRASAVDGMQTAFRVSLLSADLSGDGEFTVLYDENVPCGLTDTYRFVGGYVYLSLVTYENLDSRDITITRFDIENGTSKVIYQELDMAENPGKIWVTENHEIYLPGWKDNKAYLWKLENNEKVEIASWPADGSSGPDIPDVTDGIVVNISRRENIRWVEIRDFSGNLIYSGKLYPDAISGLDIDPNSCSYSLLGGDEEKLIIDLMYYDRMRSADYTVLLDLKDNMKATLLWGNEEEREERKLPWN